MNGEGTAGKPNTVSELNAGGAPGNKKYSDISEALKGIEVHHYDIPIPRYPSP